MYENSGAVCKIMNMYLCYLYYIGKEERIQKKKSIEEGMNQMAKGFAEGVFSYDKSFNAVNPYYCSFDEEA